MKSTVIATGVVLWAILPLPLGAQDMKVPQGCVAAVEATVSYEQYASHVIHRKTGIELVLVPAGLFTMLGSGQREVTFAGPFYISKTEVTNAQYKHFIDQSRYEGRPEVDPVYDLYLLHLRGKSIMPTGDDFPVVYVSWHNAKAFCAWAGLDLPSEAEWEYCCRAGTTTIYSFGDEPNAYEQYGWALNNSEGHPHEVAQLKPNAWGLYDMHGNVWEWCLDDYIQNYDDAPTDGSARYDNRMTKVLRGSGWGCSTRAYPASAAARLNSAPTNAANDIGFRTVLRLP